MPQHVQLDLPHRAVSFALLNDDGLDHVAALIARDGLTGYEAPQPLLTAAWLAYEGGAFIDVGANTGLYSLLATASHPDVRAVGFEPLPSIRQRFIANVAANPSLAPRIRVEEVALSDRAGAAVFHEHVNAAGLISTSSTLQPLKTAAESPAEYRDVDIEISTLDAYLRANEVGRIGLMKVDVEGHEHAFLAGAVETVRRLRPLMVVELLQGAEFESVRAFLNEHRYADLALRPGAPTLLERPAFLPEAWNHLFCPQERLWDVARICSHVGLQIR